MTFWGVHIKTWNTSENLIWNKSEKRHRSIEKFIYTILYVTHTKHWSYTVDVNPAHYSCVSFSALSLRKKARAKCKWLVTNWLARQEKENLFPTVLFAQITPRARRLRTKQEAYGTSLENILVFDWLVQPVNDFLVWNTDESTHEWTLQLTGNSTSFFLGEEEGVRETPQRCS